LRVAESLNRTQKVIGFRSRRGRSGWKRT
jgi:hypothetical protein